MTINKPKSVCVFLGACVGHNKMYEEGVRQLAQVIVERDLTLVYGGGRLGLMGLLADAVLERGGHIIGVMATALYEKEAHLGLPDMRVADSILERKAMMASLSDGAIAIPGGLGTFEELFEFWSGVKIGVYNKSCGLLNINNYYNKMLDFIQQVVDEGFLSEAHQQLLSVSDEPGQLLDLMFGKSILMDKAV